MAAIRNTVGGDYSKIGVIKDALHNPLTTTQKGTLAATLGTGNKGLAVYDTDLLRIEYWDGTAFVTPNTSQSGLTPRGNVAYNATEPSSPLVGDLYVFTSAGSNTWNPTAEDVQAGDQAWWNSTTSLWEFIQGNVVFASETIAGISERATQAEVNAGTDTDRYVSPATLATNLASRNLVKNYFNSSLSLTANTPATVTHNLGLQNKNAFVARLAVGDSEDSADFDAVDVNTITVKINYSATATLFIMGY